MPRIETKDADGKPNGFLIPIWHVDQGPKIDQVYLTTILPGSQKGPHLHHVRRGLFTCIKGTPLAVWRFDGSYREVQMREGSQFEVQPGIPVAFYNFGPGEAYLLNMPSPPWRADEPDENPVSDWTYEPVMETASGRY